MIRLDKYLGNMGIGTRKEIKKLLREKLVTVDGLIAIEPESKIDPEKNSIFFHGKELVYKKNVYLIMNKPAGYISATKDFSGKCVIDLIPDEYLCSDLFPVGRLDKDTVGLLLLTNDGKFSHNLTSPKKNIIKTYYAHVTGEISQRDISAFKRGVTLDDGYVCKEALLRELKDYQTDNPKGFEAICRKFEPFHIQGPASCISDVIVEISEGKYHQIKRMFAAIGKKVVYLKRVRMGRFILPEDLGEGKISEIDPDSVSDLTEDF